MAALDALAFLQSLGFHREAFCNSRPDSWQEVLVEEASPIAGYAGFNSPVLIPSNLFHESRKTQDRLRLSALPRRFRQRRGDRHARGAETAGGQVYRCMALCGTWLDEAGEGSGPGTAFSEEDRVEVRKVRIPVSPAERPLPNTAYSPLPDGKAEYELRLIFLAEGNVRVTLFVSVRRNT